VRAVVTGGAGFIGSHLVEALLARGDEVHVIDNLATGSRTNVPDAATFHERDIREPLDDVFAEARPEAVFHLAAQADVGTSVERPEFDAQVNVLGTLRVLEAARTAGASLVFSSTGGAIYGECTRPAREDDPREPLSPYGTSKLAGEEYLAAWNRLHAMRNVALRFANVFGPRQLAKLEGGVVAIFMDRLRDGEPVTIFGDGEQTRDFVYVGDVVAALLAATGRDRGGVFNVGTGVETSVNRLYEACRETAGRGDDPEHGPARAGDLLRSVLDPGAAERALGWRPVETLESGLRRTWEWSPAG
jgi:UDP-glucose 4-epimerase